jgi:hypothetical protein
MAHTDSRIARVHESSRVLNDQIVIKQVLARRTPFAIQ